MWTPEAVRNRFGEAADIERRMFVKGISKGGNAWPAYRFDEEDRKGWLDSDIIEEKERWARNMATSTPEITRWEEVFFDWTRMIPQNRRLLVWRWAQCQAHGSSFVGWCDSHGVVRRTAYNRMERVFENLANEFCITARLFREPIGKWALHSAIPEYGLPIASETRAQPSGAIIHPPFRTESPKHLLKSDAAIAEFEEHLADVNEARRKARLRKALRGVPGEEAAA